MADAQVVIEVLADEKQFTRTIRHSATNAGRTIQQALNAHVQPLGRITGQANEFQKSLAASNARVIAFGASAGIIFALRSAFQHLVRSTVDVERQMTEINAVFQLSSGNLKRFSADLFGVSNTYSVAFSEATKAAVEFARQGLTVEETLKRTGAALALSRIANVNLEQSVSSITSILNTFTKESLDAEEVVNRLTAVDQAYAVSSGDLAEALSRVSSSAQDANVSLNQTIGLITAAKQITARTGSTIGNSLKTMFTRLQRPQVIDDLEAVGVKARDAQGKVKPMLELLRELAISYDTLGASQKSYVAETVGGVYQINTLKAILKDFGSGLSIVDGAIRAAGNSTDFVTKRMEILNDTISSQLLRTSNNLMQTFSNIGSNMFGGSMKTGISNLDTLIRKLGKFSDSSTASEGSGFEKLGANLFQGVQKGFGNFLKGPGLQLLMFVLLKLFQRLAKYTIDSAKDLVNINRTEKERQAINEGIAKWMGDQKGMLVQILTGQVTINEAARRYVQYLKDAAATSAYLQKVAALTGGQAGGEIRIIHPGQPGGMSAASGFIPNLQTSERSERSERSEAARGGYVAGRVVNTVLQNGLQTVPAIVNTNETITTIVRNGLKYQYVNPRSGSVAAERHARLSERLTGINPYHGNQSTIQGRSLAQASMFRGRGFVPNLALSPTTIQSITDAGITAEEILTLARATGQGDMRAAKFTDLPESVVSALVGRYRHKPDTLKFALKSLVKKGAMNIDAGDPTNLYETFRGLMLNQEAKAKAYFPDMGSKDAVRMFSESIAGGQIQQSMTAEQRVARIASLRTSDAQKILGLHVPSIPVVAGYESSEDLGPARDRAIDLTQDFQMPDGSSFKFKVPTRIFGYRGDIQSRLQRVAQKMQEEAESTEPFSPGEIGTTYGSFINKRFRAMAQKEGVPVPNELNTALDIWGPVHGIIRDTNINFPVSAIEVKGSASEGEDSGNLFSKYWRTLAGDHSGKRMTLKGPAGHVPKLTNVQPFDASRGGIGIIDADKYGQMDSSSAHFLSLIYAATATNKPLRIHYGPMTTGKTTAAEAIVQAAGGLKGRGGDYITNMEQIDTDAFHQFIINKTDRTNLDTGVFGLALSAASQVRGFYFPYDEYDANRDEMVRRLQERNRGQEGKNAEAIAMKYTPEEWAKYATNMGYLSKKLGKDRFSMFDKGNIFAASGFIPNLASSTSWHDDFSYTRYDAEMEEYERRQGRQQKTEKLNFGRRNPDSNAQWNAATGTLSIDNLYRSKGENNPLLVLKSFLMENHSDVKTINAGTVVGPRVPKVLQHLVRQAKNVGLSGVNLTGYFSPSVLVKEAVGQVRNRDISNKDFKQMVQAMKFLGVQDFKTMRPFQLGRKLAGGFVPNLAVSSLGAGTYGEFFDLGRKSGGTPIGEKRFHEDTQDRDIEHEFLMSQSLVRGGNIGRLFKFPKIFGKLDQSVQRRAITKEVIAGASLPKLAGGGPLSKKLGANLETPKGRMWEVLKQLQTHAYDMLGERGIVAKDLVSHANNTLVNPKAFSILKKMGRNRKVTSKLLERVGKNPELLWQMSEAMGRQGASLGIVDPGEFEYKEYAGGFIPNFAKAIPSGSGAYGQFYRLRSGIGKKSFHRNSDFLNIAKEFYMSKKLDSLPPNTLNPLFSIPRTIGSAARSMKRRSIGKEVFEGVSLGDYAQQEYGRERSFDALWDPSTAVGGAFRITDDFLRLAHEELLEKGIEANDIIGHSRNTLLNPKALSILLKIGADKDKTSSLSRRFETRPSLIPQVARAMARQGAKMGIVDPGNFREVRTQAPSFGAGGFIPNLASLYRGGKDFGRGVFAPRSRKEDPLPEKTSLWDTLENQLFKGEIPTVGQNAVQFIRKILLEHQQNSLFVTSPFISTSRSASVASRFVYEGDGSKLDVMDDFPWTRVLDKPKLDMLQSRLGGPRLGRVLGARKKLVGFDVDSIIGGRPYGEKEIALIANGFVPNLARFDVNARPVRLIGVSGKAEYQKGKLIDSGAFGHFVDTGQTRQNVDIGKKVFRDSTSSYDIENEFRMAKQLENLTEKVHPLFYFPKTIGTEKRAVERRTIGKEVFPGKSIAQIAKEHPDRYQESSVWDQTHPIGRAWELTRNLQQLAIDDLLKQKIEARDFRGNRGNTLFNSQASEILMHVSQDKGKWKKLHGRVQSPRILSQVASAMARQGARLGIVDPGLFEEAENYSGGFIPNLAVGPEHLVGLLENMNQSQLLDTLYTAGYSMVDALRREPPNPEEMIGAREDVRRFSSSDNNMFWRRRALDLARRANPTRSAVRTFRDSIMGEHTSESVRSNYDRLPQDQRRLLRRVSLGIAQSVAAQGGTEGLYDEVQRLVEEAHNIKNPPPSPSAMLENYFNVNNYPTETGWTTEEASYVGPKTKLRIARNSSDLTLRENKMLYIDYLRRRTWTHMPTGGEYAEDNPLTPILLAIKKGEVMGIQASVIGARVPAIVASIMGLGQRGRLKPGFRVDVNWTPYSLEKNARQSMETMPIIQRHLAQGKPRATGRFNTDFQETTGSMDQRDYDEMVKAMEFLGHSPDLSSTVLIDKTFAHGFVPNLSNALKCAMDRENRATGGRGKIGRSRFLASEFNPLGMGVFDSSTQPNIDFAIHEHMTKLGQSPSQVRTAHTAGRGFVPNLAAPDVYDMPNTQDTGGVFGSYGLASSIMMSVMGSMRHDRAIPTEKSDTRKTSGWLSTFTSEGEKAAASIRLLNGEYVRLKDEILLTRNATSSWGKTFSGPAALKDLDDAIEVQMAGFRGKSVPHEKAQEQKTSKLSSLGMKVAAWSSVGGGVASQFGQMHSASMSAAINEFSSGATMAGQMLMTLPTKFGKMASLSIAGSAVISAMDIYSKGIHNAQMLVQINNAKYQVFSARLDAVAASLNQYEAMIGDASVSFEAIQREQRKYSEALAQLSLTPEGNKVVQKLSGAADTKQRTAIMMEEKERGGREREMDTAIVGVQEYAAKRTFLFGASEKMGINPMGYSNTMQQKQLESMMRGTGGTIVSNMSEGLKGKLSEANDPVMLGKLLTEALSSPVTEISDSALKIAVALSNLPKGAVPAVQGVIINQLKEEKELKSPVRREEDRQKRERQAVRNSEIEDAVNRAKLAQRMFVNTGAMQAGHALNMAGVSSQLRLGEQLSGPSSDSIARRQAKAGLYRLSTGERTVRTYEAATESRRAESERANRVENIGIESSRSIVKALTQSFEDKVKNPQMYNTLATGGGVPELPEWDLRRTAILNQGVMGAVSKGDLTRFRTKEGGIDVEGMKASIIKESGATDRGDINALGRYLTNTLGDTSVLDAILDANKQIVATNIEGNNKQNEIKAALEGFLGEMDFKMLAGHMGGVKTLLDRQARRGLERDLVRGPTLMVTGRTAEARAMGAATFLKALEKMNIPLNPDDRTVLGRNIKMALDIGSRNLGVLQQQMGNRVTGSLQRLLGSNNPLVQGMRLIAARGGNASGRAAFEAEFRPENGQILKTAQTEIADFSKGFSSELGNSIVALDSFGATLRGTADDMLRYADAAYQTRARLEDEQKQDNQSEEKKKEPPANPPTPDSGFKKFILGAQPIMQMAVLGAGIKVGSLIAGGVKTATVATWNKVRGRPAVPPTVPTAGAPAGAPTPPGSVPPTHPPAAIPPIPTGPVRVDLSSAQASVQQNTRTGPRPTIKEFAKPYPGFITSSLPPTGVIANAAVPPVIATSPARSTSPSRLKGGRGKGLLITAGITAGLLALSKGTSYAQEKFSGEEELPQVEEFSGIKTSERIQTVLKKPTASEFIGLTGDTVGNAMMIRSPGAKVAGALRKGGAMAATSLVTNRIGEAIGGDTGTVVRSGLDVAAAGKFFATSGKLFNPLTAAGAAVGIGSEELRQRYTEKRFGYKAGAAQGMAGAAAAGALYGSAAGPAGMAIGAGVNSAIYAGSEMYNINEETNAALGDSNLLNRENYRTIFDIPEKGATAMGQGKTVLNRLLGRQRELENLKGQDQEDFSGFFGQMTRPFSKRLYGDIQKTESSQISGQVQRLQAAEKSGSSDQMLEVMRSIAVELQTQGQKDEKKTDAAKGKEATLNSQINVAVSVKDLDKVPSEMMNNVLSPMVNELDRMKEMLMTMWNERERGPVPSAIG